jgi:sugar/nucleoside kinase (ribokinase family)
VIVLGDAFVDILAGPLASLPRWGADVECPAISQLPGGSALNVAVHLGTLCEGKANCSFHGLVGDDEFANILRKRITAAGVTDYMDKTANGVGTGVCLVLSGNGERAFVTQVSLLNHVLTKLHKATCLPAPCR